MSRRRTATKSLRTTTKTTRTTRTTRAPTGLQLSNEMPQSLPGPARSDFPIGNSQANTTATHVVLSGVMPTTWVATLIVTRVLYPASVGRAATSSRWSLSAELSMSRQRCRTIRSGIGATDVVQFAHWNITEAIPMASRCLPRILARIASDHRGIRRLSGTPQSVLPRPRPVLPRRLLGIQRRQPAFPRPFLVPPKPRKTTPRHRKIAMRRLGGTTRLTKIAVTTRDAQSQSRNCVVEVGLPKPRTESR